MECPETEHNCNVGGETEQQEKNDNTFPRQKENNRDAATVPASELQHKEKVALCDPYDVLLHVSKDAFANALNLKTSQTTHPNKRKRKDSVHIQEIMTKGAQETQQPTQTEEVLYWRLLCGDKLITYCTPEELALSHGGQFTCTCSVCGVALRTHAELAAHRAQHAPRREHVCSTCGAAFARSDTLRAHSRVHTGERPFLCEVCGATFTQAANLRQHARVHSGERPYRCGACAASFTQMCNLKKHERIHSGERPFACDGCSATFAQAGALKRHARKHSGERPYACEFCAECFAVSSHLKIHRRTHTGERPYRCDHCDMAFIQNSGLISHRKRAHGVFPEKRRSRAGDTNVVTAGAAPAQGPTPSATADGALTVPAPGPPDCPHPLGGFRAPPEGLSAVGPGAALLPPDAWPPAAAPLTFRCFSSASSAAEPVTYTFRVVEAANVSDAAEIHSFPSAPPLYKVCSDVRGVADVNMSQISPSGIFPETLLENSSVSQSTLSNV